MRDLKDSILELLEVFADGKQNAVKSIELEKAFDIKGTHVREQINALRSEGHPICSSKIGYWYASNVQEVEATKQQLQSRIAGIQRALEGIDAYLKTSK
jgi:biotin operon repressor